MNIIIVGCGQVGVALAYQLNCEGHNITVVDSSQEKVNSIVNQIDIMGVVGNGASHIVQREVGVNNADLFIAVTDSDELNLLCCMLAKKEGNVHTVARVRNPAYNSEREYLKEGIGLAMVINPELETAEEISRVLRFPSAISIEQFSGGRVELIKFRVPEDSPLCDLSVKEVMQKDKFDILFCSAERGEEAYITKGDFVFKPRDIISIIASPRNAATFFKKIGFENHSVRDAIIVGGGNITHYLCDMLKKAGVGIKVIEEDRTLCENLSSDFPEITVVNANHTDREALMEEGVDTTGAFIALTESDEENILLSLSASEHSGTKRITKIKRLDYGSILSKLELDTVISPKNITADKIVRYIRSLSNTKDANIENLYNVIQGKIEATEFKVADASEVVGVPLFEMKLKSSVLVAAIIRQGRIIIPRGNDMILAADSVIIISPSLEVRELSDILE